MFNKFFFVGNHAVCETRWKNTVDSGRLKMTIWRKLIARWIRKATDTQTQNI